ncbi:MAG: MOSC domain-containing protein [Opitutaceae bacterium]
MDLVRITPASQTVCFVARNVVMCLVIVSTALAIRHIFVSPGHNFFGRHGQPAGTHPALDVATAKCRTGWGLEGDRFYGYRPDYKGQITFFDWGTYEEAKRLFRVPALSPAAFRRNVVIEGIDLTTLIGRRFTLGGVEFEGTTEARPCYWMNQVVAPGAEDWLKGRGGLRAKILSDGELAVGGVELWLMAEARA